MKCPEYGMEITELDCLNCDQLQCANNPETTFKTFSKLPLYEYQLQGVQFCLKRGRALIADEMGLGKTPQAIEIALQLKAKHGISKVLILCPSTLKRQWQNEIEKFSDEKSVIVQGMPKKRVDLYGSEFFSIMNYELMLRDYPTILQMNWDMVILDETQRIKNWTTKTSKLVKMLKPIYRFALTGTPIENHLEELHSIMQFIDASVLGPFWIFSDYHLIWNEVHVGRGKVVKQVSGYKNLDTIRNKLAAVMIRRKKIDVLKELPPVVEHTYFVEMTPQQKKLYKEIETAIRELILTNDKTKIMTVLSKLIYLREVCDSTALIDPNLGNHSTKIDELLKIYDDVSQMGSKMVVFSQWTKMLHLIMDEMDSKGIKYCYISGEVSHDDRQKEIDRFWEDPEVKVFLSSDAGAYGVNLQCADYIINVELPWNPAIKKQRIARVHRIGQKSTVDAIDIVTENTVEDRVREVLARKQNLFDAVVEGATDYKPKWEEVKEVLGMK